MADLIVTPRTPSKKAPALEAMFERMFKRTTHITNGTCARCGEEVPGFSTQEKAVEYTISALCEDCQDLAFQAMEDGDEAG